MCGRAGKLCGCAENLCGCAENCANVRKNCADVQETCADVRKFGACRAKIVSRSVPGIVRMCGQTVRGNCADVRKNCAGVRENCADVRKFGNSAPVALKFGPGRPEIWPRSAPGTARLRRHHGLSSKLTKETPITIYRWRPEIPGNIMRIANVLYLMYSTDSFLYR